MNTFIGNPFGKWLPLVFIIIILITASCAKTRTVDPLTQSEQSKIKKIAIVVEADEEFDVSVSRKKKYWSGVLAEGGNAGMGGVFLIPLIIVTGLTEHGVRTHIDKKHQENLEAKLTQFHPDELMTEKLKNYLESSSAKFTAEIRKATSPGILEADGFDTILEVNLKEFGLVLCDKNYLSLEEYEVLKEWGQYEHKVGSAGQILYSDDASHFKPEELEEIERLKPLVQRIYSEKVNVWFKMYGRMVLIENNSTVWERKEFYKDETCYRLEDLKTQPELLVDILARAINNLAENTVNEIL